MAYTNFHFGPKSGGSPVARRPKLLCEDIFDIKAYEIILKYYIYINRLNVWYDYDPAHGGGSRTVELFESYCDSNRYACLCIYDSDLKFKNGTKGENARKIERKKERNNNPFVDAVCFEDLREIENALPHNLMDKIAPTMEAQNEIREQLIYHCSRESWKFLDMKEGLRESKINNCENQQERIYWRRVIASQGLLLDEDYYINGYGDNLLEVFVRNLIEKPYLILAGNYRVDNFISEYWLEIGKHLFTWFCTYKQII